MRINKQDVYDLLARIPAGKVVTYGMIGEYLGNKKYARAVGNILHENPDGDRYPCYKVVDSKGRLAESYAFGGIEAQKKRLTADGIEVEEYKVSLAEYVWEL